MLSAGQIGDDFFNDDLVEGADAPTAGIGEQTVGKHVGEEILALHEDFLEAGNVRKLFSAGQFPAESIGVLP